MIVRVTATSKTSEITFDIWDEGLFRVPENQRKITKIFYTLDGIEINIPTRMEIAYTTIRKSYKIFFIPGDDSEEPTVCEVNASELLLEGYPKPGRVIVFSRKPGAVNPIIKTKLARLSTTPLRTGCWIIPDELLREVNK